MLLPLSVQDSPQTTMLDRQKQEESCVGKAKIDSETRCKTLIVKGNNCFITFKTMPSKPCVIPTFPCPPTRLNTAAPKVCLLFVSQPTCLLSLCTACSRTSGNSNWNSERQQQPVRSACSPPEMRGTNSGP